MNGFHQMQEIYFDALHLQQELEKIPDECQCSDGAAHLSGACSCCRLISDDAQAVFRLLSGEKEEGGCGGALKKLKGSVSRFKRDRAEGKINWNELSPGERRWYFLIENAASSLESRIAEIERKTNESRLDCSHRNLLALKKSGEDLKRYLEGLGTGDVGGAVLVKVKRTLFVPGENEAAELDALTTEEAVKSLIEKHRVCYEAGNEFALIKGARTKIGYSLRLCGVNVHAGVEHSVPGCAYCRRTYRDLQRIAEWILPGEETQKDRETQFKIEPFDSSFHIAPKDRKNRAEIVLTIQILHKSDINRPADDCEDRCLKEMREKLKSLGVLEGRWTGKKEKPESSQLAAAQCENPQAK